MREPHEYDDIPGTTVFDADRSRQGYWLNQFCMSLMKAGNRAALEADEAGYLNNWAVTLERFGPWSTCAKRVRRASRASRSPQHSESKFNI